MEDQMYDKGRFDSRTVPSIVVHNGSSSPPSSPPTHHSEASGRDSLSENQRSGVEEERASGGHTPLSSPSPDPHSSTGAGGVSSPSSEAACIPSGPGPGGGGADSSVVYSPGPSPSRSRSLDLPSHHLDADLSNPPPTSIRSRISKQKPLQRSLAMREDPSPPPDIPLPAPLPSSLLGSNSLTVSPTVGAQGMPPSMGCPQKRRPFHQGSSQSSLQGSLQGSFDGSSPCLSRESSMEYTDNSGVDLLQFIIQTLHKNQKDRAMLLKIERELINLVRDSKRTHHKFQQMSSYHRMLVHRCGAYFGLEHNVDQAGTAVIVNKTKNTRLPETRFRDHLCDDAADERPKHSILRREYPSFDDTLGFKSPERGYLSDPRRSKSFEERQEEYHRAKKRIFSQESFSSMEGSGAGDHRCSERCRSNCHEEFRWHDRHCWHYPDTPPRAKHYYDSYRLRPSRLPKVESFESSGARAVRPSVFKSHSFGGYSGGVTVLTRGDSIALSERLTKQDSTSSRMSEQSSSSGYKTQRQDTSSTNVSNTLSTTPSPVTSHHQSNLPAGGSWGDGEAVMWAVTDMDAVPAGAMLINPQSGQPYVNQDGSIYRYDPSNPPQLLPPPPPPHLPIHQASHPPIHPGHSHQQSMHHHHPCPHEAALQESEGPQQLSPMYPLTPSPPRDCSSPPSPSHPPAVGGSSSHALQQSSGDDSKSVSNEEERSSSPSTVVPNTSASSSQDEKPVSSISTSAVTATYSNSPSSSSGGTTGSSPTTPRNAVVLSYNRGVYPHSGSYYGMQESNRACSVDSGLSEVTGQLRTMNIAAAAAAADSHAAEHAHHGATPYMIPRHYQPAVYYVPGAGGSTATASHIKYVYPQHYVQTTGPHIQQHAGTSGVSVVGGGAASAHMAAMPGHGVEPTMQPLMPGSSNYLPGSYTMVGYPGGVVAAPQPSRGVPATAQESGGTTYYCPAQPHPAAAIPPPPPPPPPSSLSSVTPGAAALHQYPITPTSTAAVTYPPLVGSISYYAPSMYPTAVTAGNPIAPAAGSSVQVTPQPYHHRANTPPHTTQTQVLNGEQVPATPPPPKLFQSTQTDSTPQASLFGKPYSFRPSLMPHAEYDSLARDTFPKRFSANQHIRPPSPSFVRATPPYASPFEGSTARLLPQAQRRSGGTPGSLIPSPPSVLLSSPFMTNTATQQQHQQQQLYATPNSYGFTVARPSRQQRQKQRLFRYVFEPN